MDNKSLRQNMLPIGELAVQERHVTIKVLTVGAKQFTQTLFKQLPCASILDPNTGSLLGEPWGRVNYHVGCEAIKGEHFHIVWQKDQELYRAIVGLTWTWRDGEHLLPSEYEKKERDFQKAAHLFVCARILEGWKPQNPKRDITVEVEGETMEVWLDSDEISYWDTYAPRQQHASACITASIQKAGYTIGESSTIWENVLVPKVRTFSQFYQSWKRSCEQLAQLEQLFIGA